ncbi:MAG: HlyD family efflux transporter periplasmic adaptor subunit, partial [Flavitalea sp.]
NQDLLILCKSNLSDPHILSKLITPVLAMQLGEYKNQSTARNITFKKSAYELSVAQNLFNDSVISANEYFAHRDENSRLSAEYEAFKISWKSKWEQQLLTLNSEITDLEKQQELLVRENELYLVRAPSSGILMGVNDKYPGLFIQAGELFGELSPETSLIAECIVDPSSIGMIRNHQRVTMQIDAFDHTYFGSVNGTVSSIDNDYTIMHQSPVYKVRCTIDKNTLRLKNGYEAKLKKGLTFQARFIVAKRSVFDLLFDNIDDWLNPGRR